LARWKEQFDSSPDDTKDPGLRAARKALNKKKPTRRTGFTYWNAEQFAKLQTAPPARLASKGNLTWRWLAYLLDANPAVEPIRDVVRRRLMDPPVVEAELKRLNKMLVTLSQIRVVTLDPPPPASWQKAVQPAGAPAATPVPDEADDEEEDAPAPAERVKPPTVAELKARLLIGEHVGTAVATKPVAKV